MRKLKTARELIDQAGSVCQFHITVGDPTEMILQFAKEKSFDQITIGPHGVGTAKSLLLGSVANKVV